MAKRWFEVTENAGVHANTGITLRKGERHFLEETLVGAFEGEEKRFVCSGLFREVNRPHPPKEEKPTGEGGAEGPPEDGAPELHEEGP
jgi:hypothetical protein